MVFEDRSSDREDLVDDGEDVLFRAKVGYGDAFDTDADDVGEAEAEDVNVGDEADPAGEAVRDEDVSSGSDSPYAPAQEGGPEEVPAPLSDPDDEGALDPQGAEPDDDAADRDDDGGAAGAAPDTVDPSDEEEAVSADEDAASEGDVDVRSRLRAVGAWCSRHAGVSVALGTCVALAVIAGGFAIGAKVVMDRTDAAVEEQAAERLAQEGRDVSSDLPAVDVHFNSLSRAGFPSVSANLTMRAKDGSQLPAFAPEQLTVLEVDEAGTEVPVGLTGFAFDPASGGCQLSYTADTAQLAGERTVRVSLNEQSGYRGSASMSYRV